MKPAGARLAGVLVAVAGAVATVWLSGLHYSPPGAGRSFLRLSWRAVGELVEECRQASDEENARLPAHMRREQICEGRTAPFHLLVLVDGRSVIDDTVAAAGARGDRPVYVFREVELQEGVHEVDVDFITMLPQREAGTVTTQPAGPGRGLVGSSFPDTLRLDAQIAGMPGRVTLITYDEDRRALVARTELPR